MTAARVTLGGTVDRYHVGTMGVVASVCTGLFVALSSLGVFAARQTPVFRVWHHGHLLISLGIT